MRGRWMRYCQTISFRKWSSCRSAWPSATNGENTALPSIEIARGEMRMRGRCCRVLLAAICIAAAGQSPFAHGQAGSSPRDLPKAPKADQVPDTPVPGKPPMEGRAGESLSEQLTRSEGVIKPPAGTDPEIRKPAPETSSPMPVLPPPGSPGGWQDVRPK